MRTKTINFIATLVIAVVLSFILPWWSIMLAATISGFAIPLKRVAVFMIPFLAVFLYWFLYSYWLSSVNDFILAKKIAVLIPLYGNPYLLILVTAVIGGIAAGIAGVFGNQLRLLINKKS